MSIFEKASINKLRFPSIKGDLTTEQLWDVPLTSKTGFDLDTIAKGVNAGLKAATEDSFVSVRVNPAKDTLELAMEILKHIIAAKLHQADVLRSAAARAEERKKLVAILGQKQDEALHSLTPEEIQKRLDALG